MASFFETPFFKIAKNTLFDFIDDKGLKLSASLAYYTIFALAPLLLLVMSLVGIFFGKDAIEGRIFVELNGLIGPTAALQIQEMIKSIQLSDQSTMAFTCLLYTSPSPRDRTRSRMPSSA